MRIGVALRPLVTFGLALTGLLAVVGPARAQRVSTLDPTNLPKFGAPITGTNQTSASANDDAPIGASFVANLDSSIPRNTFRLRLDLGYDDVRPTRAEYLMARGGLPFSPGLPLPEPRINSYQEASAYVEYAPVSFFSAFLETPVRWLNPDANANTYGFGDVNFGLKLCTWSSQDFVATLQLRCYDPTASQPGLGTHHWTLEPALLGMWRPFDNIIFEGDVRYWTPLGGTDFAGDVLRYGIGLSLGQTGPAFWYKPVVEGVGWTVLGGKAMAVTSPDSYVIQSAAGSTIVNGSIGLRVGMGTQFDAYAGYGRCFTGSAWTRDFVRVELRLFY